MNGNGSEPFSESHIARRCAGDVIRCAANEPSGHASCVGTLSVFNQAHPEVFGSRSESAHLFIEEAAAEGIPPGQIYNFFAKAHGNSGAMPIVSRVS